MFKWLFHILIFATSGKYQIKEKAKPLKRQRKLGLISLKIDFVLVNSPNPDEMLQYATFHLGYSLFSKESA